MPPVHVATISRTRMKGIDGGWGWLPTCSCGWRAGSTWGRAFKTEPEAKHEIKIHRDASIDRNDRRILMERTQPVLRSGQ
jgi:hypothetical protein